MENKEIITQNTEGLLADVRSIVEQGLHNAYQGVNVVMVKTYWQVGRRIVEEEQQGESVLNMESNSLHYWLRNCRKVIIRVLQPVTFGHIVSSI